MRSDKSIKVNLEAVSSNDLHRYPLHNIYIPNKYFWLLTAGGWNTRIRSQQMLSVFPLNSSQMFNKKAAGTHTNIVN